MYVSTIFTARHIDIHGYTLIKSHQNLMGKFVPMSRNSDVLRMQKEADLMFLTEWLHLGSMREKVRKLLLLAAHTTLSTADSSTVSSRSSGPGCDEVCSCAKPLSFSNFYKSGLGSFPEVMSCIMIDPKPDQQLLTGASYITLPTIALCNTDHTLQH